MQNFDIRCSAVHKNIIGLRGLRGFFLPQSVSSVKSDDKKKSRRDETFVTAIKTGKQAP
jgi:hypothetical protein